MMRIRSLLKALVTRAPLLFVLPPLLAAGCGPTSSAWSSLGPHRDGAIILSLAADPAHPGTFYAGSSDGSVYRMRVSATGLPPTGSGIPPATAIDALLPDAHAPNVVYAGTSAGFYRSLDAGAHWARYGSGLPAHDTISALAFANAAGTLAAGTTAHGIYMSADSGLTWHPSANGLPPDANIDALWWDHTTGALFAAADGVGVFISHDAGQSWAQIPPSTGLTATQIFALGGLSTRAQASQDGKEVSGQTLYAGSAQGLFASANDGHSWSQLASGHGLPRGRILSLAVDPMAADVLYVGTDEQVFRSTDGGLHWALVAPGIAHPVAAVLVSVDSGGHAVVFAAAGDLLRYPAS